MSAAKFAAKAVGGGVVYLAGTYAAYEYFRPVPALPDACERCHTFQSLAPKYDSEIEKDERSSGILELRREITAHAKGKVLEVAGGTGRNLAFYTDAVAELTIGDFSEEMLKIAAGKIAKMRADGSTAGPSQVTLAVIDAAKMPLETAQYDTVLDSFGVCSFEQPQAALQEMKRVCRPGGSILLLEHGVSDWSLLAWWQQHRLNRHVVRWGCYWNRDILAEVKQAGLDVVEQRRLHFGTTYYIRCQLPEGASPAG